MVLSGGFTDPATLSPEGEDRLRASIALARHIRVPRFITTRIGRVFDGSEVTSDTGQRSMLDGVDLNGAEWVIAGTMCRTTADEARAVAEILPAGSHIALVTTAYHGRRATATFRKAGFHVTLIVAPEVRYRARWTRYVRDAIGLLAYRWRGYA